MICAKSRKVDFEVELAVDCLSILELGNKELSTCIRYGNVNMISSSLRIDGTVCWEVF